MSGASDLVSDDEVRIACVLAPYPRRLSAHAAAASLADRDYKVPIPPHSALVLCDNDDRGLSSRLMLSCPFSTSLCSTSTCPAGLWPWSISSWVGFISICFFFSSFFTLPEKASGKDSEDMQTGMQKHSCLHGLFVSLLGWIWPVPA
jgi:hypothetical protein